ncbi:MAG: cysteine hydrolase [Firmicutes bacterium]|nr:cysteine hydrolase [Bacillota bacterium]
MKVLIAVDMQKDFIDGTLGSAEAEAIVAPLSEKLRNFNGKIILTRDTHGADYLATQEGRNLPVEHCIKDTDGWQINADIIKAAGTDCEIIDKPTFGSVELGERLAELHKTQGIESIELAGLCTDICVISNAMLVKAFLPEVPVKVDASCCAGVTPESHDRALAAMETCQIEIIR